MKIQCQDITCPRPTDKSIQTRKKDTKGNKYHKEALLYKQTCFEDVENNAPSVDDSGKRRRDVCKIQDQ